MDGRVGGEFASEWASEWVCGGGGGFIHLFPYLVEVWYKFMEMEASSLATAHSAHGMFLSFSPFCLYAFCGFLDLQVDLLSLSMIQTYLNCFLSSPGALYCFTCVLLRMVMKNLS